MPQHTRRCLKCQGLGHLVTDCLNRKAITLKEWKTVREKENEEKRKVQLVTELKEENTLEEEGGEEKEVCLNEPLEEVKEGLDEGELLVIRRALSGLASHDEFEGHNWKLLIHEPAEAKGSSHPLLDSPSKSFTTKVRERIGKSKEQANPRAKKPRKRAHFQPGDLVWVDLRKETFPNKRKSNLLSRSDGPFEIIEKIGPRAYKVDLHGDYGVLATFNVADLSPYHDEDEEFPSLRSNSNQSGEYDGDHITQTREAISHDPFLVP